MILGYIDPGSGYVLAGAGGVLAAFFVGFLGILSFFFKGIFRFVKRHWKILLAVCVFLTILITFVIGKMMKKEVSDFSDKIIVLGFDGLSPDIIEPMMKEGKLPNFKRLMNEGSYRKLATTNPSQSPVAWSGFATGQNPGKNGVFDFIVRDPESYRIDLSLSRMEKGRPQKVIKSDCFWNYTSEKSIPTTIITCPVTYPAEKITGRMLSGMGVPDILGTEGTFTFYTSERLKDVKTTGGKVLHVNRAPLMVMDIIGPKVARSGGRIENVRVPFKAALKEDAESVEISFQGSQFTLGKHQWSDWQEVAFKLGLFRKAKGIVKFYLVETGPEFKLYISPVNFDPRSPLFRICYPDDYSNDLVKGIGLFHTQGMPMDTWAVNEGRLTEKAFVEQVSEVLGDKRKMLNTELNDFEKGVLFCYFESPDIVQHMFWRYIDP